jgi:hypothetical protein
VSSVPCPVSVAIKTGNCRLETQFRTPGLSRTRLRLEFRVVSLDCNQNPRPKTIRSRRNLQGERSTIALVTGTENTRPETQSEPRALSIFFLCSHYKKTVVFLLFSMATSYSVF